MEHGNIVYFTFTMVTSGFLLKIAASRSGLHTGENCYADMEMQ